MPGPKPSGPDRSLGRSNSAAPKTTARATPVRHRARVSARPATFLVGRSRPTRVPHSKVLPPTFLRHPRRAVVLIVLEDNRKYRRRKALPRSPFPLHLAIMPFSFRELRPRERGGMTRIGVLGLAGLFAWGLAAAPIEARAQAPTAPPADGVHLGVASCAGSTCHGAVQPLKGSVVAQNEYIIWSRQDKHAKAYAVLSDERSQRIAKQSRPAPTRAPRRSASTATPTTCRPTGAGRNSRSATASAARRATAARESWLGVHISGAHRTPTISPPACIRPTSRGARGEMPVLPHGRRASSSSPTRSWARAIRASASSSTPIPRRSRRISSSTRTMSSARAR